VERQEVADLTALACSNQRTAGSTVTADIAMLLVQYASTAAYSAWPGSAAAAATMQALLTPQLLQVAAIAPWEVAGLSPRQHCRDLAVSSSGRGLSR